ncbi:hypothetical protein T440DRAFT_379443, partial [Plenodomus tracheiphilus IPT5]
CTTAIPGKHGYVPIDIGACNAYWAYNPSLASALAFSTLFGLLTLTHLILAILHRKPFCWIIITGTAWEFASFVLRALGSRDQQNTGYSIAVNILFLLAPLWINAFVYMTAGRLIWMLHPDKSVWRFKAISLGKYFVWLDILSFLVQGTGGLMLNPGSDAQTQDVGKKIYMSGMGVQQFFIVLFVALLVRFHVDALGLERRGVLTGQYEGGKRSGWWKYLMYTLYSVLVLITIRIIFRLCEFTGGVEPEDNMLPYKEGYALALDAFPMVLASLALAVVHPGVVLKGADSEFPARKQRRAEKKMKKAEKKAVKEARKKGEVLETECEARY